MTKKKHLYEIDLMRAFIMLCVLSVHTIAFYMGLENVNSKPLLTLGSVISLLHFTRESFMFITGLVLFITYYHREFHPLKFWLKRLTLVAIPYVAWNIMYLLFEGTYQQGFDWSFSVLSQKFLHSLMFGNQFYLYYVLVTIQLYIVFPALLYGLRKLARWHVHIFIGSFLLQLILLYVDKFYLPHLSIAHLPAVLGLLDKYRETFILTYQFWFVAGGVIACHYQRILQFVQMKKRLLMTLIPVSVLILCSHYLFDRLVIHESEGISVTVLQPIMVPYSLLITCFMWYLGSQWAKRREQSSWLPFSRYVKLASDTSFGIFLLQPFPLYVMKVTVLHMQVPHLVHLALIPVSVLFVYFTAMVMAYIVGKVPYLSYCVGRKVKWTREPKTTSVSTTA